MQERYSEHVPYGLVIYGNGELRRVYPTESKLLWLFSTLDAMQNALVGQEKNRSHSYGGRCKGCGVREICGQQLLPGNLVQLRNGL